MTISNKDEVTSIEPKEGEGGGGHGVRLEVGCGSSVERSGLESCHRRLLSVKLERTLQERIVGSLDIGAEVGDPDKQ